jgi:trk system potassium uptake protein TrkH
MFVLIVNVIAFIRERNDAIILKRRIPDVLIKKATAIITVHFTISFVLCISLMVSSDISFIDAMFEIMSAVSTVGLSRAITPGLNTAGRIIVILAMYLGRIGPISMFLFFQPGNFKQDHMHFADGKFIVG